MSLEAMIAKCESFLGTRGRPNEATRWYADRNGRYFADAPWCNMFITWAAHESGNYDAVCFGKDYAYTVWHAQRFEQAGQWHVDVTGIRRGDIVFFDWNGSNRIGNIDHIGIVTDVNGRDVMTIEGNTSDTCSRRVRHSAEIVGYGRPVYAAQANTWVYTVKSGDYLSKIATGLGIDWQDIAALNGLRDPYIIYSGDELTMPGRPPVEPTPEPPAPAPAPAPPPTPKVVSLSNLVMDSRHADVGVFQQALKDKGYDPGPVDSWYGTMTRAACKEFQVDQGWADSGADGLPGPLTVERLGLALRDGDTAPQPPPTPTPGGDGEPAHDYRRVTYGGKTVNQRTKVMLERAVVHLAEHFEWTPVLTQGSYNRGVSASAGTHDGGGVVDIRTSTMSRSGQDLCVQALRKAGFAAWLRLPPAFSTHIHAVAIGDRELSPSAKSQIQQWREDRDGLARRGPDPAPDPYPAWTQKYR